MKTAMLFREIGRFTRAAEEGRDIISQARGEITDIAPTTAYRVFVLQELLLTSSTLFCLVFTDLYRITLYTLRRPVMREVLSTKIWGVPPAGGLLL